MLRSITRPVTHVLVLASGVLLAAGCATYGQGPAPQGPRVTDGTLAAWSPGATAVSYDPTAAPAGGHLHLQVTPGADSTVVTLHVDELQPNRGYAVHAHAKPCGPTGEDAGPHFQNRPDPAATPQKPSSTPAFANPTNEVWLDLHTDATGSGTVSTTVPFAMTAARSARSVVIHEKDHTSMTPGQAGTAGGRIACMTSTWS